MGRVYLAHDPQLDRQVALKVPLFGPEDAPPLRERFYREGRAAATVLHANVCPVYDVGEVNGVPYLTMAFIEGRPLAQFAAAKPLTPKQAAFLVRKLALALAEAHKRGVIHRDLKPANVMVNRQGEPVVMDFGLARRSRGGDPRLTRQGAFLGTPAYAPPEQVSGDPDQMGPACDVYSLGVILYELLAGRLPFEGDVLLMISRVLLEEPPPPSRFRPDLDPALEAICLKAMAKKVEDRYASMAAFAGALQSYLRGTAPAAESPPAPVPASATAPTSPEAPGIRASDLGGLRSVAQLHARAPTPRASAKATAAAPPRRRKGRRRRGVPVWAWAGGAGLALVVLLVPGVVAYRLAFYGTIRFEPGEAGAGAELRVDGEARSWGEALRLRTGEHRLEVSAPGYVPLSEPVAVHRGDNSTHRVRLERAQEARAHGSIRIEPSEWKTAAKLKVDGADAQWGKPLWLPAGKHQLEVAGEGLRTVLQPFTVRPGDNELLVVPLQREQGGPGQEAGSPLNALTAREKAAGWKLLFDGRTTAGWRGYNRETVPDRWRVEDGALALRPGGAPHCDLVTDDRYDDFELAFEWKVSAGANSGVLYRVADSDGPTYITGPEYQILDNAGHPNGQKAETAAASCYGMYGPARDLTRPVGEWNHGRILVNGNQVEHWLNGEKVVAYELDSPDWRRRLQGGRNFKNMPSYGKVPKGRIALQDQGLGVAYRNLKLRPLSSGLKVGEVRTLRWGGGPRVFSTAFSPDGRYYLAAGDKDTVRVWDVRTGEQVGKDITGGYLAGFTAEGQVLTGAWSDSRFSLYEPATGRFVRDFGAGGELHNLTLSPGGDLLLAANPDGLRLWDVKHGKRGLPPLLHWQCDPKTAHGVFGPDERSLLLREDNQPTWRVWDPGHYFVEPRRSILKVKNLRGFLPAAGQAYAVESTATHDIVQTYDVASGKPLRSVKWEKPGLDAVAWTADARRMLVALKNHQVLVYDMAARPGPKLLLPALEERDVQHVRRGAISLSPDGRYACWAGTPGYVKLWRLPP
jgi:WD40 repeat protein